MVSIYHLTASRTLTPRIFLCSFNADLHLLLNTLSASSLSSTTDSSSWLPICLPKFNPNGFLHAYVSFMSDPSGDGFSTPVETTSGDKDKDGLDKPKEEGSLKAAAATVPQDAGKTEAVHVGLAAVTANRDGFERLQEWAAPIIDVRSFPPPQFCSALCTAALKTDVSLCA